MTRPHFNILLLAGLALALTLACTMPNPTYQELEPGAQPGAAAPGSKARADGGEPGAGPGASRPGNPGGKKQCKGQCPPAKKPPPGPPPPGAYFPSSSSTP